MNILTLSIIPFFSRFVLLAFCIAPFVANALTAEQAEEQGKKQFAGINFGVGISLTIDTGSNERVDSAQVVDGIVRVDAEEDKIARVMLESHYFFTPEHPFNFGFGSVQPNQWGVGPFIALQPGTQEIIEAIGFGLMIGFRRPEDASGSSWNFGVGWITDPNVQILGDGFQKNAPPPGSETEVRYKETSQDGLLLLFSFSF